jgi:hypothetical protein
MSRPNETVPTRLICRFYQDLAKQLAIHPVCARFFPDGKAKREIEKVALGGQLTKNQRDCSFVKSTSGSLE